MYKGHPFASKVLQKIEKDRMLEQHRQNIRLVRPTTDFNQTKDSYHTLNPKKKEMQKETKCTQIQRENRLLLEKINHIMGKRKSESELKNNGSLNSSIRKKQGQSIEVENAKMLRRLQDRKSDYSLGKLKKQWKKTKQMIKNITSYPLVIDTIIGKRKRRFTNISLDQLKFIVSTNPEDIRISKTKIINDKKFIITVKFTYDKCVIIGDLRAEKELKVIDINKEEAFTIIQENCNGNVNRIFDCLRYDQAESTLFLTTQEVVDNQRKFNSSKQIENKDGSRLRLRQKRMMSQKPIYEGAILERQDLIF